MSLAPQSGQLSPWTGLGGSLRLLAMALVLVLAGLGVLTVLDVIPMAALGDIAVKTGLIGAIAAVAVVAFRVLMGRDPGTE